MLSVKHFLHITALRLTLASYHLKRMFEMPQVDCMFYRYMPLHSDMTLLPENSIFPLEYMTFRKQDPSVPEHNFKIYLSAKHSNYNGNLRKKIPQWRLKYEVKYQHFINLTSWVPAHFSGLIIQFLLFRLFLIQ